MHLHDEMISLIAVQELHDVLYQVLYASQIVFCELLILQDPDFHVLTEDLDLPFQLDVVGDEVKLIVDHPDVLLKLLGGGEGLGGVR